MEKTKRDRHPKDMARDLNHNWKFLTMAKMHHPKADVDRLYIPRKAGGKGLVHVEITYKTTIIGLNTYLSQQQRWLPPQNCKGSWLRQENKFHTASSCKIRAKTHLARSWSGKEWASHELYPKGQAESQTPSFRTQEQIRRKSFVWSVPKKNKREGCRPRQNPQLAEYTWHQIRNRRFHYCCPRSMHQEQLLPKQDPVKDGTDPMCRICAQFQEKVDHLVSGCPELAKTEHIQSHNKAAAYLHWTVCKHYNIKVQDKHFEHEPATVTENQAVTILWDMPIQTDKEIKANRPDIVVKHKKERTCLFIDMSIPTERNTSLKQWKNSQSTKLLRLKSRKRGEWKQQLSQWSLELSGLSRREQKTTSARSQAISE